MIIEISNYDVSCKLGKRFEKLGVCILTQTDIISLVQTLDIISLVQALKAVGMISVLSFSFYL